MFFIHVYIHLGVYVLFFFVIFIFIDKEELFNVILSSCFSTGEDSPLDKLVNYIIDTRGAEESEKDDVYADRCNEESHEVSYKYTIILFVLLMVFVYNFANVLIYQTIFCINLEMYYEDMSVLDFLSAEQKCFSGLFACIWAT